MSAFRRALAQRNPDAAGRRWLFVPYDQLTDELGPLARESVRELGIVLIESPRKASLRPYHQQKLALVLANLRHFALEQAERGVAVRHEVAPGSYGETLVALAGELGPLRVMEPAERELRVDLQLAVERGALHVLPHEGWLTSREQFLDSQPRAPYRMDAFYRAVRKQTGVLMAGGKPLGGRFSFDTENRKPWRGSPKPAQAPEFTADAIVEEVAELVRTRYARHPGQVNTAQLPATRADAERVWEHAKRECLPDFGPWEDAMSASERRLFHTAISPLLNLSRLTPRRVLREAVELDIPLPSKEGFVRQLLGWREYMRHVHVESDGFRNQAAATLDHPGDGGYASWSGQQWLEHPRSTGGASPSALGATNGVPPAYWGKRSGLSCLDKVIEAVWGDAYSHHITRLMVLSNIAMLLDVSPRELTDWFWVAYYDAYDWVVEPNVLAMGSFGVGDSITTKPYVAGAAYINRMSDYCERCQFDPRSTCPLTPMYWAFLDRHRAALEPIQRMRLPLLSEARRSAEARQHDRAVFEQTRAVLARGEALPGRLER